MGGLTVVAQFIKQMQKHHGISTATEAHQNFIGRPNQTVFCDIICYFLHLSHKGKKVYRTPILTALTGILINALKNTNTILAFLKNVLYLQRSNEMSLGLSHGVMVALRFLVPSVKVRILVGQHKSL